MHQDGGVVLDPDVVDVRVASCKLQEKLPLAHTDLDVKGVFFAAVGCFCLGPLQFKCFRPFPAVCGHVFFPDHIGAGGQFIPGSRNIAKSHLVISFR